MYRLRKDPRRRAARGRSPARSARMKVLVESCDWVVIMDDAGTEISGGSILIDNGVITWIGTGLPPTERIDERIDGRGTVATPGLINTHHHLYPTLTPTPAQGKGLLGWLQELYPIWAGVDDEWLYAASRVGLAELALSGCATTTDHHYIF